MMTDDQPGANKSPNGKGLTADILGQQTATFSGSGGISAENRSCGFSPAFLDSETGIVYPAQFADGRPAPIHLLDGLPDEVVISRQESGTVSAVKPSVIAGFLRRKKFFTREQTARAMRLANRIRARLCQGS